ncbi:hypothetical protein JB92DRAFT_3093651 [Gautieria morchelliformis]|nr:hypothetical protein JB92DRAFT_3093651 [Gautieria morchelliformis]
MFACAWYANAGVLLRSADILYDRVMAEEDRNKWALPGMRRMYDVNDTLGDTVVPFSILERPSGHPRAHQLARTLSSEWARERERRDRRKLSCGLLVDVRLVGGIGYAVGADNGDDNRFLIVTVPEVQREQAGEGPVRHDAKARCRAPSRSGAGDGRGSPTFLSLRAVKPYPPTLNATLPPTRNPASDEKPGIIPQTPPRDDTADEESGEIANCPAYRRGHLRPEAATSDARQGASRRMPALRHHAWDDNDGRGDYGSGVDCGNAAGCGSTVDCIDRDKDKQRKEVAAEPRDGRGERKMIGGAGRYHGRRRGGGISEIEAMAT